MNSIGGQYTQMTVQESGSSIAPSVAVSGAVKGIEPLVTLDSVVVNISPEALKLQSFEQDYESPQNGAGTLPPTEETQPDQGDAAPGLIVPFNGGGTLPPDPPKSKP